MKTVKLTGNVDEHHRLSLDMPPTVPPGPVEVVVRFGAADDDNADQWAAAVAEAFSGGGPSDLL